MQDRSRAGLRKYINEELCKQLRDSGESKSNFLAKSLLFQKPSPSAARFTPYHNANASKTDICSRKLKILQQICQIKKSYRMYRIHNRKHPFHIRFASRYRKSCTNQSDNPEKQCFYLPFSISKRFYNNFEQFFSGFRYVN